MPSGPTTWVDGLKLDFDDPTSPTVATEFVGTSVSSHGPSYELFTTFLPDNPHVRLLESRLRGTPRRLPTRFQAISNGRDPEATVSTLTTFVVVRVDAPAQRRCRSAV